MGEFFVWPPRSANPEVSEDYEPWDGQSELLSTPARILRITVKVLAAIAIGCVVGWLEIQPW